MRYQKVFACAALALNFVVSDRAAAALLGVDVSSYQSTVNWTSMKNAGVQFGFARATMGTVDFDSQFASNMNNSRTAGVQIGPYHYGYPNTAMNPLASAVKQDAINEATDFVNRIKPYYDANPGWYLRPVLDVEEVPSNAEVNTIAEQKTYLSAWIKDFNSVVKTQLGVDVIIYCNGNFANTYLTQDLSAFDLWFAKPTNSVTTNPPTDANMGIWSDYDFWQYSWEGNLGGESPLDLNHYRGTLSDLQQYVVGDVGPEAPEPVTGDFNGDGVVNAADYTVWRDNFLKSVTGHPADANKNNFIDIGDRNIWATNYGATSSAAVAVPEPTALVLAGLLALTASAQRRR
jgi:GH25 family lysozyme M1 (1,4-beta-N-acetylmuramidase)